MTPFCVDKTDISKIFLHYWSHQWKVSPKVCTVCIIIEDTHNIYPAILIAFKSKLSSVSQNSDELAVETTNIGSQIDERSLLCMIHVYIDLDNTEPISIEDIYKDAVYFSIKSANKDNVVLAQREDFIFICQGCLVNIAKQ